MAVTNRVIGIIVAMFVAGIIGPTALVNLSNSTALTGVNSNVITVWTVLLPTLGAIAIAMLLLASRKS